MRGKGRVCYRSARVTEPSKTAFLRPRPAANHTDNLPKPLLERRGFLWGALQEVISYGLTFLLLVALKQGSEPQAMSAADPQELRSPLIRPSQGRGVPPIMQTTTQNPSLIGGLYVRRIAGGQIERSDLFCRWLPLSKGEGRWSCLLPICEKL